jgi:hypothetical protein
MSVAEFRPQTPMYEPALRSNAAAHLAHSTLGRGRRQSEHVFVAAHLMFPYDVR